MACGGNDYKHLMNTAQQRLLEDDSLAYNGSFPDNPQRLQAPPLDDRGVEYPEPPMQLAGSAGFPQQPLPQDPQPAPVPPPNSNYPQPEIIFANVNYPVLPADQIERMGSDVAPANPQQPGAQADDGQLDAIMQPHPLFKKSNFLAFSHFVIMGLFIWGCFKLSQDPSNYKAIYPAFLAEFGLAFLHYLLRLSFHKAYQRTQTPFNKYEIVPEVLRLLAAAAFIAREYFDQDSAFRSKLRLSDSVLYTIFFVFNVVGCLSRFNFMWSLFSSSMGNLAVSVIFPIYVNSARNLYVKTPLDSAKTIQIMAIVFAGFMLFIAAVKTLTLLVYFFVQLFSCSVTLEKWKFTILSNIWGVDYLLFSSFVFSCAYLMNEDWAYSSPFFNTVLRISSYGYIGFYPLYTICNFLLPFGMETRDLEALRNFENEDMDEIIRDNMEQRKRGGSVRVVRSVNSAEKMITLFQVSPFFFSETEVKKAKPAGNKFEFTEVAESQECVICFDQAAECLIMNCYHGGVCAKCSRDILMKSPVCPFCRAKIKCVKVIERKSGTEYLVKETLHVK